MEGRTPAARQRWPKATEVYWLPWSEWWITVPGRRCSSAMSNAASTRVARACNAMDQPTTRRLQASSTTARCNACVRVGM